MAEHGDDVQRDWVARDRRCVIHPYAAPISSAPLFTVRRAEGVQLTLDDGRVLIDGMSSWWAAIHGYNHPLLNAALGAQLAQHEPRDVRRADPRAGRAAVREAGAAHAGSR